MDDRNVETNECVPLLQQQSNEVATLTTMNGTNRMKGEYSPPAKTDTTTPNLAEGDGDITISTSNSNPSTRKLPADLMQYSRGKQILLFTIMLLVNVLGPLSTEAQVPALQNIAIDLNTTSQWVQLTITIYMLSFGASQLFFGTLSDMYGRRNTLIAGLVIYVVTNVGCALAPTIAALNVFRALQAMGSGAGMVIVYAIARDVFTQDDRTRVLGILGGLRPIVIAASPVFGGSVTAFLGWRYIFWIIGALSLALLIAVVLLLPETKDPDTVHITTPRVYFETVKLLIKKRVFIGLVLISGAVYAGVFIMFNEFSFVMENRYGFSEFTTGLLCGGIVFGLMIGSVISIGFVKCMDPITVVCIGIAQIFFCGCLLILPVILFGSSYPDLDGMTVWWSLVPLFFYVCADGLMLPHLISTALEPFKECAGTASALAGFWRFFSAAVIALIVSAISPLHLPVLHLGTAGMGLVAGVIYLCTLVGADASEFTRNHQKLENRSDYSNDTETKPLIDVQKINKYGSDVHRKGNITVEPESE
jgi:DHA1 family bicyclomycin/chloramphenicol resistance-like MFS transporter